MTRADIIRMAQEAGGHIAELPNGDAWVFSEEEQLYRFANLIEQHLSYDGIHMCHGYCQRPACVREAMQWEREACAKLCEDIERRKWEMLVNGGKIEKVGAKDCAEAIRARGEK